MVTWLSRTHLSTNNISIHSLCDNNNADQYKASEFPGYHPSFMIFAPRTLLSLLVLVPCINASSADKLANHPSRLNYVDDNHGLPPQNSKNGVTSCRETNPNEQALNDPTFVTSGKAEFSEKGKMLRKLKISSPDTNLSLALSDAINELGDVLGQSKHDFKDAIELITGFIYGCDYTSAKTVADEILKFIMSSRGKEFNNLFRALQYFDRWPSSEQFHLFWALAYKSESFIKAAWEENLPGMDWNKNFKAIFIADNSDLYNDIQKGNLLSVMPLNIAKDMLLKLIIEHDSSKICKSLNYTYHRDLISHLGPFPVT
jgi:hypothetical protein